jgi:hypothetical protein
LIKTAWKALITLDASPNMMPSWLLDELVAALVAWFGSKMTPEKKPMVTTEAAARERRVGYCCCASALDLDAALVEWNGSHDERASVQLSWPCFGPQIGG